METLLFSNNAQATLAAEFGLEDDTIYVVDEDRAAGMFRSPQHADTPGIQLVTLTHPDFPGEYEIVSITARSGNTFSVGQRAVEVVDPETDQEYMEEQGHPRAWPAGTKMSARVTAGTLAALSQSAGTTGAITRQNSIVMDVEVDDYESQAVSAGDFSLVFAGRNRLMGVVQLSGSPTLQLENAHVGDAYWPEYQDYNLSFPSVGGTPSVDLGAPTAWEQITPYRRGSVVVPTTPNGHQYWAEPAEITQDMLSGSTEPVWSTSMAGGPGSGTPDGSGDKRGVWRAMAMPIEFEQLMPGGLVVTEVGFVAHKVTASTVPHVSIGTAADPDRFASNVQLSQITGDGCIHRIPITAGGMLATELHYKVDTAATGGQFLGRFYWRGFFVESWT